MSKRGSRRRFIRVVCTDMYIDRQTGLRCARHQQFRLGRLPVFVEKDQDGNALPGTEYVGYHPDATLTSTCQPGAAQNAVGRCRGPRDIPMRGCGAVSSGAGWTPTPNALCLWWISRTRPIPGSGLSQRGHHTDTACAHPHPQRSPIPEFTRSGELRANGRLPGAIAALRDHG